MSPDVEYRDIDGFDGYRVGNDGSVWSCRSAGRGTKPVNWHELKPCFIRGGYKAVGLKRNGKNYKTLVHRIVLSVFVGPPPEGMQGCHNNGNPADCRLENLRWGTPKENLADAVASNTICFGSRQPISKLNEQKVAIARQEYAAGLATTSELAKRFGVAQVTMSQVLRGKTWRRVGGPVASKIA